MNLLPNESILIESKSKSKTLTLTTHRIKCVFNKIGRTKITSIMLEELDSRSLMKKSQPIFMILALIFAVAGLPLVLAGVISGPLILSIVFGIIYFVTREQIIVFSTAKADINFKIRGMNLRDAIDFIDAVEKAKNARYLSVR